MEASAFPEENTVLDAPDGVSIDRCNPLSACRTVMDDGTPVVISCWRPTKEEMEEMARTGRVWLMIWGHTMFPAKVMGVSPFKRTEPPPDVTTQPKE